MGIQKQDRVAFRDISARGKDRKWRERKLKNIDLARRLEILGYRSFERVYQCSEVLKFLEQEDGSRRLYQTYFCKNKLCPICNWRRSMKYSFQAEKVVNEAIRRYPKGQFLFLTLTVRNVDAGELNSTISSMSKGFNKLFKYKKVSKNMLGYIRATEVTYNREENNYHPHFHILIFVKSTYFSRGNYLSQEEWTKKWQKAMVLDYSPIVDVRKIYSKGEDKKYKKAILEVSKYPIKPFDLEVDKKGNLLFYTEEEKLQITDDLMNGLFKKRQIGFGGLFKELKKEFDLDDVEDGDLVNTSDDDGKSNKGKEIVAIWNWERKNYFLK